MNTRRVKWGTTFFRGAVVTGTLMVFAMIVAFGFFPDPILGGSLALGLMYIIFTRVGRGGIVKIPVASIGVPLIIGRRSDKFVFDEGNQWLGPIRFFFDFQEVSLKDRALEIDPLEVFSHDNVKLRVTGTIIWHVVNPYLFLQIEDGVIEHGLDDLFDQVIRKQARTEGLEVLLGAEFAQRARDNIQQGANGEDFVGRWGIEIVRVPIPSIQVDDDILKALSKKRLEQLQREGEAVEQQFGRDEVKKWVDEVGVSPSQGVEVFQTERDKVKKEIKETKVSVDDNLAASLGGAVRDGFALLANVLGGQPATPQASQAPSATEAAPASSPAPDAPAPEDKE